MPSSVTFERQIEIIRYKFRKDAAALAFVDSFDAAIEHSIPAWLHAEREKEWVACRKHWRHWLNVHACKSFSRFLVRMLVTLRYLLKGTATASAMTTPGRSGECGTEGTGRLTRPARAIVPRSKLRV